MIIINTTALLALEVSIERVPSGKCFFVTAVGLWDLKKTGSQLETKYIKS